MDDDVDVDDEQAMHDDVAEKEPSDGEDLDENLDA